MNANNRANARQMNNTIGVTMAQAQAIINAYNTRTFYHTENGVLDLAMLEYRTLIVRIVNLDFQLWNVSHVEIGNGTLNLHGEGCPMNFPILDYTPEPEPVALVPTFDHWLVSISNLGNSRSRTTNIFLGSDKTLDDVRRIVKARAKRGEVLTSVSVTRGGKTIHIYTCPRQQYLSSYNDHSWTPGYQNFARRVPVFQGRARYDMIYTRKGVY